jgi:hypothetical protein
MSPWVRLDDHFDDDPRIATAGPSAAGLLAMLLAYSNRNLCDGFVSANTVRQKAAALVDANEVIALMVKVGLLHHVERDGIPGFAIHPDFVQLQPTREQVEAERESRKVRKQRWKDKHLAEQRSEREPEHDQDTVRNADGTADGTLTGTPTEHSSAPGTLTERRSEQRSNGDGTHRPVPDPDPDPVERENRVSRKGKGAGEGEPAKGARASVADMQARVRGWGTQRAAQ